MFNKSLNDIGLKKINKIKRQQRLKEKEEMKKTFSTKFLIYKDFLYKTFMDEINSYYEIPGHENDTILKIKISKSHFPALFKFIPNSNTLNLTNNKINSIGTYENITTLNNIEIKLGFISLLKNYIKIGCNEIGLENYDDFIYFSLHFIKEKYNLWFYLTHFKFNFYIDY